MKIVFIFPRAVHYDSFSIRQLPSGGTEKTVIFLGEAFSLLGHEVEWITTIEELECAQGTLPDMVITQEAELFQLFPNSKKVWWCHHFVDQPIIQRGAGYGRALADKVVTLSKCQADEYRDQLRIDSVTIGHGVWLNELHRPIEKDPYRLIYASTPFRGLAEIPRLFRRIKDQEPRATISICSSMATYGEPEKDAEYQAIFDELASIEGVELKGSLNQEQLYREYARASVFFYPCTWRETYCLALDEAIAHGCCPVVTDIGVFPERSPIYSLGAMSEIFDWPYHRFGLNDTAFKPRDWMDVARRWETTVLN